MELVFSDGSRFELSYELLRVYSPSAEVRGHGPGQEVLQVGKRDVEISSLEPSGSYAVQPTFSDGHTGIYSWDYLYWLGKNRRRCGGNTSSASNRPGEPRAGRRAFRGAAEIKVADPFKVVLINPYELGRQPFALAEPAAWLKREGFAVACIDLSLQKPRCRHSRRRRPRGALRRHAYRHAHRGRGACRASKRSPRRPTCASTVCTHR